MIKLDGVWVGSINRAVLEAEAAESAPATQQGTEAPGAEAEVKPKRSRAKGEPNGNDDVS